MAVSKIREKRRTKRRNRLQAKIDAFGERLKTSTRKDPKSGIIFVDGSFDGKVLYTSKGFRTYDRASQAGKRWLRRTARRLPVPYR